MNLKKNLINKIAFILSTFTFWYGMWQHDLACQYIWQSGAYKQPFCFWYPYICVNTGLAYDITLILIAVGWIVSALALWFWD